MSDHEIHTNEEFSEKYCQYMLGLFLVVVAALFFIIAIFQVKRTTFADFPCDYEFYPELLVESDTRIAYCISFFGREYISGGGIYADGAVPTDELIIESRLPAIGFSKINIQRNASILAIEGQSINVGQTYKDLVWYPALNPWLIFTNHLTVWNRGLSEDADALLVYGELQEGWFPSPIGLLVLIIGIRLMSTGQRKMANSSEEAK